MGTSLCIVVSTNRTIIHLSSPNVSLDFCSAVCACTKTYTVAVHFFSSSSFKPQRADSLTWWPIKSKVQQPLLGFMVTFDINHRCPGSAVRWCPRDSSDHSLTVTQQSRPLHQYLTGRALTGHEVVTAWRKKKNLQAVLLLEVSLTALRSLWVAKRQNLQEGLFS